MQVTSSTQLIIPNYLVILLTNASYIINSGGNIKLPCYTLSPMQVTSSTQLIIPNYLVILSHECKLHHQLSWKYQITLLYFPTNAIYIINQGGNTKLPCYTLRLNQHHNFFRNLPPLFPEKWIKPVDKLYAGDVVSNTGSQSKRQN